MRLIQETSSLSLFCGPFSLARESRAFWLALGCGAGCWAMPRSPLCPRRAAGCCGCLVVGIHPAKSQEDSQRPPRNPPLRQGLGWWEQSPSRSHRGCGVLGSHVSALPSTLPRQRSPRRLQRSLLKRFSSPSWFPKALVSCFLPPQWTGGGVQL